MKNKPNRRTFIRQSAVAAAGFYLVPRHVLGGKGYTAPSDKLNIGCIGIGGKGRVDVEEVSSQNIIALCDVDQKKASNTNKRYPQNPYQKFPKARPYEDFRVMLDQEKDLDAVTISTPDHTHAVMAMRAINQGKHVFLQKPLTRTIKETREITEAARSMKVATQMGNQGHANEGPRILVELVRSGAIGPVSRVHVWTNRPIWPQGIEQRPSETPAVPDHLNWDLWLGPAPYRAYHPDYVPFNWRGWWDFGCGALGDMGCHLIDFPFWALELGHPETVEASSSPVYQETAPVASVVHYYYPANINQPALHMTWYDGGILPAKPAGLPYEIRDHIGGVIFEGSEGQLVYRYVEDKPVLLRNGKEERYDLPEQLISRSPGHYQEWIDACKGGKPAMANFEYSGPLTEVVLLGNVAIRSRQKLSWDGAKMKVINHNQANKFLQEDYRKGWSLT
ncbi:MAG: Gfo/Idh/MocA family protein [Candidatus Cyclobacteriaceae bacterium M3_2C_046]